MNNLIRYFFISVILFSINSIAENINQNIKVLEKIKCIEDYYTRAILQSELNGKNDLASDLFQEYQNLEIEKYTCSDIKKFIHKRMNLNNRELKSNKELQKLKEQILKDIMQKFAEEGLLITDKNGKTRLKTFSEIEIENKLKSLQNPDFWFYLKKAIKSP